MKKAHKSWGQLLLIPIPLIIGGISAFLSREQMDNWSEMTKPPLSPSGWVFSLVWTILYIMMGIAAYILARSDTGPKTLTFILWIIQLILNFAWSPLFFRFGMLGLAAFTLCLLIFSVWAMIYLSSQVSKLAMAMFIPYGIWLFFALYLNVSFIIMK